MIGFCEEVLGCGSWLLFGGLVSTSSVGIVSLWYDES
jgi:hypothetical protein